LFFTCLNKFIEHVDVVLSSPKTKLKLFGALSLRSKSESKFYLTVDFMANLMHFLATRSYANFAPISICTLPQISFMCLLIWIWLDLEINRILLYFIKIFIMCWFYFLKNNEIFSSKSHRPRITLLSISVYV